MPKQSSVPDRPLLMHERLGQALLADLRFAQTADLDGLSWRDLAVIRGGLASSQRLQIASGTVASRDEWAAATQRVQAQMDRVAGDRAGRSPRKVRRRSPAAD